MTEGGYEILPPQFSLITSTLNRTRQLENFLQHLDRQTWRNFEYIIVDQNDDDRLVPIINKYRENFAIMHIHSAKGVSRGRNTGIKVISGDFVAFPDDDCWYEDDLLERATDLFIKHPDIDMISGRTIDAKGQTSLGKFDKHPGKITKRNVFKRGNTNTFFFRRAVVEKIAFDESIGVGAGSKWGSGEETDYLLQALAAGFKLYYCPDFTVYHEEPLAQYNDAAIQRGYSYALGMGRVMKKHHYSLDFVLVKLFYQMGGMLIALARMDIQRFKYHRAVFKGRYEGWKEPCQ
ncbi:MAG TPA: glycosyltransferase [Syntrophomonadaceae bacterium]|nr:glycosyltransferase [Syntrophomonadaceae bacterium]HPR93323.1 glycosyltransferase [Syntrophomonadaceae bacterium]